MKKFIVTLFLVSFLLLPLAVEYAGAATTVPTPLAPTGTITDTTPTYKWSKITGATKYRFKTIKGSTTVYTIPVPSSACGTTTCKKTPTQVLSEGSYKWKVQAYVDGAWKTYSAYKTFSFDDDGVPKAGYWNINTEPVDFYVTSDSKNVDNFSVYFSVGAPCSKNVGVRYDPLVPIVPIANEKTFSFTSPDGVFHANGTFDTATSSHGQVSLNKFPITACPGVSVSLAWDWKSTWQDNSQPTAVVSLEEADSALSEDPSITVEEIIDDYSIELDPDNQ